MAFTIFFYDKDLTKTPDTKKDAQRQVSGGRRRNFLKKL